MNTMNGWVNAVLGDHYRETLYFLLGYCAATLGRELGVMARRCWIEWRRS